MPVDWETIRANNLVRAEEQQARESIHGIELGHNLSPDEADWLHQRRTEEQERQAYDRHQDELNAFHRYTTRAIQELQKPGHENPRTAEEWDRIRTEVCVLGKWPDSFVLNADAAACMKFQDLRARLGKEAASEPRPVVITNPHFMWS